MYNTLHTSSTAHDILRSLLDSDGRVKEPRAFSTVCDGLSFSQLEKLPTLSASDEPTAEAIVLAYLFSAGCVGWPSGLSLSGAMRHPMEYRLLQGPYVGRARPRNPRSTQRH
jgi:hypothetical protein